MSLIYFSNPEATDADYNMAFDEWLLAQAIKNPDLVYLRLYRWEVGSITFGVNQRAEAALDHSKLGGTPLIRRVTGGRALYHDRSELTYTVAFNSEAGRLESLIGSINETSIVIAEGIRRFLVRVGIEADWVRNSSRENSRPDFFHKAPCFASSAKYELVGESHKIVASAQRRFHTSLMQHGSIKIGGIVAHPALDGLSGDGGSPQPIGETEFANYARLFGEEFALHLGAELAHGVLSDPELDQLNKYSSWVNKNRVAKRLVCDKSLELSGVG